MRIIGIDPGLATVGIGVVDAFSPHDIRVVDWLTLQTAAHTPLPDRLQELQDDLSRLLTEHAPALAVVERLFFAANERTAMDVAQARGVLLLSVCAHGIPLIEPTPLQMKQAVTGDGSAGKRQVQDMMVRLLGLTEIPRPDDAADALGLAVYGALRQFSPLMTPL